MRRKTYHHGDLKNALIKAGVEILSQEGVEGLSLRKVAQRAGVSHNAPYSHFPDKQSLIAAISTEGFRQLYGELDAAVSAAGTPHSLAAAVTSMARAAAPALRICSYEFAIAVEPPVPWTPKRRFL